MNFGTMPWLAGLLLAVGLGALIAPPEALAQKKVEITQKWNGSVLDEKAMKPEVITGAKEFEALWKEWGAKGDLPKVDFTKNIVVAIYSVGSQLTLSGATLDANGNLDLLGIGTDDIRPGFRYVLGVVSREGVKTVNKKALPAEK